MGRALGGDADDLDVVLHGGCQDRSLGNSDEKSGGGEELHRERGEMQRRVTAGGDETRLLYSCGASVCQRRVTGVRPARLD